MDKYTGFYIDKPTGNNIFSYEERENKKILKKRTKKLILINIFLCSIILLNFNLIFFYF